MGKKWRGIRANWTSDMMDEALRLLKKGHSQRHVESVCGIPRSTLRDHIKTGKVERQLGRKSVLSIQQEQELSNRIIRLSNMGVPLTPKSVRRSVFSYCKKNQIASKFNDQTEMAGYSWYKSFMRRHPELSKRKAQSMNWARAQKLNPFIVKDYFTKLSTIMDEFDLKNSPHKIFNLDEKGCRLTLHHSQSVLAAKGSKRVHLISNEHAENVTVVACISASGQTIPPMIIFKGVRKQDTFSDNLPPGSVTEMAPKGSMTKELFLRWLHHFAKFKPSGRVLLILDGASCHIDVAVADLAETYDVSILCLPSNTTHELQPLDKAVFRSFEHYWDSELLKYWEQNPSANRRLTKSHFGKVFQPVWQQTLTMATIQSGFRSTGIYPFDPTIIPECAYLPSLLTNRVMEWSDDDDIPLIHFKNKLKKVQVVSPIASKPSCSHWDDPVLHQDDSQLGRQISYSKNDGPSEQQTDTQNNCSNDKIKILSVTVIKPKEPIKEKVSNGLSTFSKLTPTPDFEEPAKEKISNDPSTFSKFIPTPDFKSKKQGKPRKKAINYKAQILKRDVFFASSNTAKSQKSARVKPSTIQNVQKKEENWFCSVCNENYESDMRQCNKCKDWVHEDCVGLTIDDLEDFECPECSP